ASDASSSTVNSCLCVMRPPDPRASLAPVWHGSAHVGKRKTKALPKSLSAFHFAHESTGITGMDFLQDVPIHLTQASKLEPGNRLRRWRRQEEDAPMHANIPAAALGEGGRPATWFEAFASRTSQVTGKPVAFLLAFLTVLAWAVTGPLFHYSDT